MSYDREPEIFIAPAGTPHCVGESTCPACWSDIIRIAITTAALADTP